MTPYDIIEKLRATSGTLEKRAILREHKDDELFQKILTLTLDPRITYGIKKIPTPTENTSGFSILNNINLLLNPLVSRESTGKAASAYLAIILGRFTETEQQVVKWIIAKDFKAGFGVSLINDEMAPFSVYEVPYMGAKSYSDKGLDRIFAEHPFAYSEVKYDGRYLNTVIEDGSVFFESRGGRPNPLMGALEEDALKFREEAKFDGVLNGELILKGVDDRYIANGIIASYISIAQKDFDGVDITKESVKFTKTHEMTLQEVKEKLNYVVWDYIPLEDYRAGISEEDRSTRLVRLEETINKTKVFELVEYRIVNNKSDAMEHFQEMLARGEEGTIIKGALGNWKDGKHAWAIKVKLDINLDLRITGFNYGTIGTKNENVISSVNVESEDGTLTTSPGGIKESMMEFITENQETLLGKLVEVNCKGLSQDSKGNWSCLHPVFKLIRDDKERGDTLEDAQNIENMAKGLV